MSNIVRVPAATAGTVPTDGTDYQKQNNLIYAFGLWGMQAYPLDLASNKVVKGAMFNLGGVLYHASADEAVTGTPSEYVKLTPIAAGAECSAEYVSTLTGVSWNDNYNGYTDGPGNLYLFDEAKAFANGVVATPKTLFGKAFQSIPHGMTTITTSGAGTFVVPAGVYGIYVTTIGGGGGGGGNTTGSSLPGGGGGAGAGNRSYLSVTPGQSISYSVGAGGSGGAPNNPGVQGGNTTFTGATGSVGGAGGTATIKGGNGGGGDNNLGMGGPGGPGTYTPALGYWYGGQGGGPGWIAHLDNTAGNGIGRGGGGAGASFNGGGAHSGGNGASGCIIVEW